MPTYLYFGRLFMNELREYQTSSLAKIDKLRNKIIKDASLDKPHYKNHLTLLLAISDLYKNILVVDAKTMIANMSHVLSGIDKLKTGI